MSITRIANNIKYQWREQRQEIIFAGVRTLIHFFLLLISFFSGILYERSEFEKWHQVQISYNDDHQKAWQEFKRKGNSQKLFVASKNGTKVYPIDCSSAKRIKEENRIYFQNLKQAHSLGYENSKQCGTN